TRAGPCSPRCRSRPATLTGTVPVRAGSCAQSLWQIHRLSQRPIQRQGLVVLLSVLLVGQDAAGGICPARSGWRRSMALHTSLPTQAAASLACSVPSHAAVGISGGVLGGRSHQPAESRRTPPVARLSSRVHPGGRRGILAREETSSRNERRGASSA